MVLLNRSLLRSFKSGFVHSVTISLSDSLQQFSNNLSPDFHASVLHIILEVTELVCGKETYSDWNDSARVSILKITKIITGNLVTDKLELTLKVQRIFLAVINV